MTARIPLNGVIPTKVAIFSSHSDNQPGVLIQVCQGEASMTAHCSLLGRFELSAIQPAPRCVLQINVAFVIDANGIPNVSAEDKATNKKYEITDIDDKGTLSMDETGRMDTVAKYKAVDDAQEEKVEALNRLENFYCQVKDMAGEQFGRDERGQYCSDREGVK